MTVPPEAITAAAKDVCAHYWAYHCFGGLSVRLCHQCHEPDWDDVRAELAKARAEGAAAERDRIAAVIKPERLRQLADWFDADDEFKTTMFPETWPTRGREVQDDLRAWADLLEEAS